MFPPLDDTHCSQCLLGIVFPLPWPVDPIVQPIVPPWTGPLPQCWDADMT